MVRKSYAAIELREARQALLHAGHADQHEADALTAKRSRTNSIVFIDSRSASSKIRSSTSLLCLLILV